MRPITTRSSTRQLRPDLAQPQKRKCRLLDGNAVELGHQRDNARQGRMLCASSVAAHPSSTHQAELQPHTEWGQLMAQSVAQLQTYSDDPLSFKIKGVSAIDDHTGEHRQQLLSNLHKTGSNFSGADIPVMFMKQADNPVDPQAVAVMSGAGQIGYVPAELTHLFDHFCSCGFSDWIWKPRNVPNALYGCSVTCNPTHRAAHTQVVPPQLAGLTDMKRWLPVPVWNAIEQQYTDRMLGCCQITSLPSLPLFPHQGDSGEVLKSRVFPIWSRLDYQNTLKLEGFQVLCGPVVFALCLLDLHELGVPARATASIQGHGENTGVVQELIEQLAHAYGDTDTAIKVAKASAVDALLCCNSWYKNTEDNSPLHATHAWSHADVDNYIQSCWARKQQLHNTEYQLDVSLLLREGFLSDAEWMSLPAVARGVSRDFVAS